jgi:small subunit ribosomal protein S17
MNNVSEGIKAGSIAMEKRGHRKVRTGRVVSDKMDKTGVLLIERRIRHPFYKKIIKRSKRVKFHDEKNECHIGDVVSVMETRPQSREKRWRLLEIIHRGSQIDKLDTEAITEEKS